MTTAVLARLLDPKDFGLIALALTFMSFLDMLQGLGVADALVVAEDSQLADESDSAFVVSSSVGLVLWAISAALGPLAAAVFHEPRLVVIMPAIGSTFFIQGLGSTHYALAMKSIDFRSRTIAELTEAVVRGTVGVVLALLGVGVWALIGGYIAGSVAMSWVVWHLVEYAPRLRASRRHLRRLLTFGGALTGVGIMAAFLNQFDNVVVGRVLGATQLGFYSIATRLPYLFIITLAAATGQVLFPAFAALEGDAMVRGFLTSLRYTAFVALPLTAILITLAEPLTLVAFGPQWHPAVAATQVLCLWALMSPISMVCGNAFKAQGRPGTAAGAGLPPGDCAHRRVTGLRAPGHRRRFLGTGGDRDRGAGGDAGSRLPDVLGHAPHAVVLDGAAAGGRRRPSRCPVPDQPGIHHPGGDDHRRRRGRCARVLRAAAPPCRRSAAAPAGDGVPALGLRRRPPPTTRRCRGTARSRGSVGRRGWWRVSGSCGWWGWRTGGWW